MISYEKKEGGFNRCFVMFMDDGTKVVARLPTCIAGPRRLTTNSEVATMTYLRSHTTLPVPRILDWSDDSSNPIGAEYIIMENVAGVRLHERWSTMTSLQHMRCVKELSMMIKEMVAITFPGYGSLYFSDAPFDPHLKLELDHGFCIGPHCESTYWNCNTNENRIYGNSNNNHGPWLNLTHYCSGLIETGFARIPRANVLVDKGLPYQGSIEEHIRLLNISREVIEGLIESPLIQNTASPTLLHADLHTRNIFVSDDDPTLVTGLIDWQSTSVEPAFIYANETPDFATYPDQVPLAVDRRKTPVREKGSVEEKEYKDALICSQAFDVCMKGLVPKLRAARALDDTLLRPFRYCHTSWRDGAAAVRQELIEVSKNWKELGLAGSCPDLPTEEELVEHKKQYEDFETVQKLKILLIHALDTNSDGWVPTHAWEWSKVAHRVAFEKWVQTARDAEGTGEDDMTEEKARRLWPFDQG